MTKKKKPVVVVPLIQEVSLWQDRYGNFWLQFFNTRLRKVFTYDPKASEWKKGSYLKRHKLRACTKLDFLLSTGHDLYNSLEGSFGLKVLKDGVRKESQ